MFVEGYFQVLSFLKPDTRKSRVLSEYLWASGAKWLLRKSGSQTGIMIITVREKPTAFWFSVLADFSHGVISVLLCADLTHEVT